MPYFPIFLVFNGLQHVHKDQKSTYDVSLLLDDLKTVRIPSQSSGRNVASLKARSAGPLVCSGTAPRSFPGR